MPKLVATVCLTVVLTAAIASTSSATAGPAMVSRASLIFGQASNLGSISGNGTSYPAHRFTAGVTTVSCATVTGSLGGSFTASVAFMMSYSGCSLVVTGTPVAAATVHSNCSWNFSFSPSVFNNATGGATGGTVAPGCVTSVTSPAVNCQLDFAFATLPGVSAQNIDWTGSNSTASSPWGMKLVASITGWSYSVPSGKSCPGVVSPGSGGYTGTMAVPGVWLSL